MSVVRKVSMWIFGEEGDILTDSTTQALIVASSVLVTGTMLMSPLIADLAPIFDISSAAAGWLIIGYTAAGAITLPIVGVLADRIGRKRVMVTGLLIFGFTGAGVGIVTDFEVALALRVFQGMGFALTAPVILALFGDIYRGSRETTAQGMRVSVNGVMNTFIPILAGILFVYSWRYPFAVYLIAVPAAAWIWVAVPEVDASNDWSLRTYFNNMAVFLSNAKIALLMLSFAFRFIVFYGILTFISVLAIQEAGLAVVAVGVLLSIRGIVKTVASTQAGRLSLSYDPAFLSVISFFLVACGTVLMGAVPTPIVITLGIILFGIGDGILSPSQKSLVNRLSPPEYRGGAMATALTFQNIGQVIGPAGLAVALSVIGPAPAFVFLGITGGGLGFAALLCVWIWPDPQ